MNLTEYNHTPPSAPELEEAILGALMLERDSFDRIENIINDECFYQPINRAVFNAIHLLYDNSQPIDLLTVYEQLKGNETFEKNGSVSYLANLTSRVSSAIHIENHARILREKQIKRSIISACSELQQAAYEEVTDVADVLNDFANTADQLNNITAIGTDTITSIDASKSALLLFESRQEKLRKGEVTGIPTGLTKLDQILGLMQPGQVIIIAARAAMGKTAFALNLLHASASSGYQSAFLSLEMNENELINRLILRNSDVRSDVLKNTIATEKEIININVEAGRIARLPITFIRNSSVTINA
ncbi:MAG: DnaB-like helicase N-terminal domain-containing protein, partial [Odoribacter sp.]